MSAVPSLRKKVSPALLVAIVALVFAMGGTAAATTVIITSNSQVAAHTIAGASAPSGDNQNLIPGSIAGSDIGKLTISGANLMQPKWVPLTLMNGWSGGPFGTASPAIAMDDQGIVHLRGAMADSGTFNAAAFVLSSAYAPTHTVFVPIDTVNATTGRLEIETNGTVLVQDTASGANAKVFASLDGVTYSR